MENNNLIIYSNVFEENKAEFGNIYLYHKNNLKLDLNNNFSHSYCTSGCIIIFLKKFFRYFLFGRK